MSSKFMYLDRHWDDSDICELDAKSWEEVPEALIKAVGPYGADNYDVFEVVSERNINIRHLVEREIQRRQKEKEDKEKEARRQEFLKLKEEFGNE